MGEPGQNTFDIRTQVLPEEDRERERLRKEQLKFIEDINRIAVGKGISLYLFAGFADDLVLNEGSAIEDHGDVDIICMRKDLNLLIEALREIGCDAVEEESDNPNYYSSKDNPHKINARRGEVSIDIPIMDFDEERQQPYYVITNNEGRKLHIYFDQDFLPDNRQPVGTLPKTVSPLGLIQTRVFYPQIQDIEWREKDRIAAEALRDRFFPGEDLNDPKFMPEIIEIKT